MQRKWSSMATVILSGIGAILGACAHQSERGAATQAVTTIALPMRPSEGMWLPNALPADQLKREFGFEPSAEWAEHLRLSSVKIGASGAFVSPDGLVLTNHHVAVGRLQD